MGKDVGLEKILCNLFGSNVTDLVVGEIELGDGLVEHQTFEEVGADDIIINQVSWQGKSDQTLCLFQAVTKDCSICHFHSKVRSLVFHSQVLSSIGQLQVHEILEAVEH